LFTLSFESGKDYVRTIYIGSPQLKFDYDVANLPLFSREDDDTLTFSTGKPHLLTKDPYGGLGVNYYVATHVTAQSLINNFFAPLVKMLNQARVIEVYLNLTDEDIQKYNSIHAEANCPHAFVPVFFQQFSRYFYINKIQNYISGKLTKCELIKL